MENRDLILTKNGQITSLELLKEINFFRNRESNFGKAEIKHKDLLKIVRSEFDEEIAEGKISLGSYLDKQKQERPMFILTISQAKQVLVRESKVIRKAVIKRLEELENKVKVPTNFKEALQLALKQQEELENKNSLLIEQKPKVEFYDTVTGSKDTLDFGAVAKVINKNGYGRNKLFKFLRRKKILMQNNQPYQKYIDNGCFRTIETKFTKSNGEISINIKTLVYQKGVDLISKLLDKNL